MEMNWKGGEGKLVIVSLRGRVIEMVTLSGVGRGNEPMLM